jgi:hypothetical protein
MAKQASSKNTASSRKSGNFGLKNLSTAMRITKTKPAATKPKRPSTDDVFGHHLPSSRLRLPASGNVTALEQVVLLTELLRSHDPLNRLIHNRADNTTLTFIINQCRTFPKYPLEGNSLCKLLHKTMREWGNDDWTIGKHQSGKYNDTQPVQNDLTLTNMQLNCDDFPDKKGNREGLIHNVPFEDLAIDVTRLPTSHDALDLTRCVLWSLHHPDSGLMYPRDFAWLTAQLGGPKPVRRTNYDRRVFVRWDDANKLQKASLARARGRVRTSVKDYNKAETDAKQQEALQTYNDATELLKASKTPLPALVTVENKVRVIHGELLPTQTHQGPDMFTVALHLNQFVSNPPNDMPTLDYSASPEESGNLDMDVQTPVAGPVEVVKPVKDRQPSVLQSMDFSEFRGFGYTRVEAPLGQQVPLASDDFGFDPDLLVAANHDPAFGANIGSTPRADYDHDQSFSFGV